MEENNQEFNSHLSVIFTEVLPLLTDAGIKYWVFGGIGIAGIAGKFLRENQDVDTYVVEEDFHKVEPILKKLCEEHGDWDADRWVMSYSMLKGTQRPKLQLSIKGIERFSVVPVYKTIDGVEFRVIETFQLPKEALTQVPKSINGFHFFSPPDGVLLNMLRSLIEGYIAHYDRPEPPSENSKHSIDVRAVLSREEVNEYMSRFSEKAKMASAQKAPNQ